MPAVSSSASLRRPASATDQPSASKLSAEARPMPLPAPVMTATRSAMGNSSRFVNVSRYSGPLLRHGEDGATFYRGGRSDAPFRRDRSGPSPRLRPDRRADRRRRGLCRPRSGNHRSARAGGVSQALSGCAGGVAGTAARRSLDRFHRAVRGAARPGRARDRGNAARQGRDGRQAGRDDTGSAFSRRGNHPRDRPDLVDRPGPADLTFRAGGAAGGAFRRTRPPRSA